MSTDNRVTATFKVTMERQISCNNPDATAEHMLSLIEEEFGRGLEGYIVVEWTANSQLTPGRMEYEFDGGAVAQRTR